MQTVCGTHSYLAPELVQTDRGVVEGYGKAIDMWGVGMLTFVMLFGFNPFERETQQETHDVSARTSARASAFSALSAYRPCSSNHSRCLQL
eukprot:4134738-Pleurochrysis_carterae.AAC.2